jgi:hypothetical protein
VARRNDEHRAGVLRRMLRLAARAPQTRF